MALGNQGKPSPQLLDSLYALNELVRSLMGEDLKGIIQEIKDETAEAEKAKEASDASRLENEKTLSQIQSSTEENRRSAEAIKKERQSLEIVRAEAEKQVQINKETQEKLALYKKELDSKASSLSATGDELSKKARSLAEQELKLIDAQNDALAIKEDYEGKLADLKKITG